MPSKTKPLTEAKLRAYESKRDLADAIASPIASLAISMPALRSSQESGRTSP